MEHRRPPARDRRQEQHESGARKRERLAMREPGAEHERDEQRHRDHDEHPVRDTEFPARHRQQAGG
jgi:hypothetical protein